jgi:formate hydrogenlyase subunit 4
LLETLRVAGFYLALLAVATAAAAFLGLLSLGLLRRAAWRGMARGPRLTQPLRDVLKLLRKETLIPAGANRALFVLMPLLAFAAVSVASAVLLGNVLWQNGLIGSYRLAGDALLVFGLLAFPAAALAMGAAGSGNPFAAVAAERTVRLMSCLLPMGLALTAALVLAGRAQRQMSNEIGRQVTELTDYSSPLRAALEQGAVPARVPVRAPLCLQDVLMTGRDLPARRAFVLEEEARLRLHRQAEARGLDLPQREVAQVYMGFDGAAIARRMDLTGPGIVWARVAVLLCVLVFVIGTAALAGLSPFDSAEDAGLGGGVLVEYGGPLLAVWTTVRAMLVFCLLVFSGLLFLGGFSARIPGAETSWGDLLHQGSGVSWGAFGLGLAQLGIAILKYIVPLLGLGLLVRDLRRRDAAASLRFFTGPAVLAGLGALAIAVMLLWQAGGGGR